MTTLAAATRPTRRDVLRHPLRSLAAIILIMIPVTLAAIGVVYNGSQSSSFFLSSPRTSATYVGGVCEQSIDGYLSDCAGEPATGATEYELLRANIPEGFTVDLTLTGTTGATFGERSVVLYFTQTTDSMAPAPGEAFIPQRFLDSLGAEVGDTITLDNGTEVTVAGVTPSGTAVFREPAVMAPEDFSVTDPVTGSGEYWGSWSITGPEAFTWDDVLALNAVGFTVTSRDVIDNPPPADQVTFEGDITPSHSVFWGVVESALWFIPVAIIGFLLLMLISPVFTISVSRQTRTFALLASQGATPRHIRWSVLMYGLFAGLVGATLGVGIGTVGTAAWWSATYPAWPVVVDWLWLLAAWVLAVAGSTAAAFLPAFIAGRSSIIRGVHGGGIDRILRWRRWMAVGPAVLLALGVMFLVLRLTEEPARTYTDDVYVPWREALGGFGILFAVIAVVASAPAMVWVVGQLRGPLPLRLAARDLLRQSMRSIPAVAALAGVIFVATGLMVASHAESERMTAAAGTVYPAGTVFLGMDNGVAGDLDPAIARVESQLGDIRRIDVYGHSDMTGWMEVDGSINPHSGARDWVSAVGDSLGATAVLASPELLDLFQVRGADLGGRAVLTSSLEEQIPDARLRVRSYDNRGSEPREVVATAVETRPVLPPLSSDRLITEETFEELGLERTYLGAVLVSGDAISPEDARELNDYFLDTAGVSLSFPVWPTDHMKDNLVGSAGITALVIAVMALVLALSSQQTRRQQIILEAVGAEPAVSRWSNALFGALCTIGAALLGLVTGHVAALLSASLSEANQAGVTTSFGTLQFTEPLWPMILGTLVIAPLVVGVIGWVFTPRVDLAEYRE